MKPESRPQRPFFSSGPCAKRPGWSTDNLSDAVLGRSHRSNIGKSRLQSAIEKTRKLLDIPEDHYIGIVPGSDTGAMEMALWSMLGARGIDLFAWESFGKGWVTDVTKQLKLEDVRIFDAAYGELPDLSQSDANRDAVFVWNGTTSGVMLPNANWIDDNRNGITLCDATSAAFAMQLPWQKLDVVTWSWQKVLGGEAAHGMLVLSPRAVERLQTYTPPWPLPKLFRMTKNGKLNTSIFEGSTINTPSMLCLEDYLDTLQWAESIGGLSALINRSQQNAGVIENWLQDHPWGDFLAADKTIRSHTSVCLKIVDPWFTSLPAEQQANVPRQIDKLLEHEHIAYDINGYRDAPPGLRIWCGGTIEKTDVEALLPWLDWAYSEIKEKLS